MFAEFITCGFDGFGDDLDGVLIVGEVGGETAFVADGGAHFVFGEDFLE